MAWSTPRTWVASELVTAAHLNGHVRDNLNALKDYLLGAQDLGANFKIGNARWLIFKDPALAHGMTSILPTDEWAALTKFTSGGLGLFALSGADQLALSLSAIVGSATPTAAAIDFSGAKKSGTTRQVFAAGETVMTFSNLSTLMASFLGNGDLCLEGNVYFATGDALQYDRGAETFDFIISAGASRLTVGSNGAQIPNGTISALPLAFQSSPGTGLYRPLSDALGLVAAGVEQIRLRSDGDVQWMVAQTALGGGAAPTVGTIGGTGPGTAAQNSWLRIRNSTGTVMFIPCWLGRRMQQVPLSKDELAACIDALVEYAEHHLPTLARSMPQLIPSGNVDELRGNYMVLVAKLRREIARPAEATAVAGPVPVEAPTPGPRRSRREALHRLLLHHRQERGVWLRRQPRQGEGARDELGTCGDRQHPARAGDDRGCEACGEDADLGGLQHHESAVDLRHGVRTTRELEEALQRRRASIDAFADRGVLHSLYVADEPTGHKIPTSQLDEVCEFLRTQTPYPTMLVEDSISIAKPLPVVDYYGVTHYTPRVFREGHELVMQDQRVNVVVAQSFNEKPHSIPDQRPWKRLFDRIAHRDGATLALFTLSDYKSSDMELDYEGAASVPGVLAQHAAWAAEIAGAQGLGA